MTKHNETYCVQYKCKSAYELQRERGLWSGLSEVALHMFCVVKA